MKSFHRVLGLYLSTRVRQGRLSSCLQAAYASSSRTVDPKERRKLWMLVIPVTTFCLGTWQIFRLQWKVDLIEELERKTKRDPIDIPTKLVTSFIPVYTIVSQMYWE